MFVGGRLVALAQHIPAGAITAPELGARPSTLHASVWDFSHSPMGRMRAVVLVPTVRSERERFPLLIALHGYGEYLRGVERGAWGWATDYELGATDAELRHRHLREEAFLGFVSPSRLRTLQRGLAAHPYRGCVVVCPFTPDVLGADAGAFVDVFASWIADTLVPRARRELPVLSERTATGIDGVSLGGLEALEVGFTRPDVFGVVGGLQAAVHNHTDRVLARYVNSPTRPPQVIRLVTSSHDIYRRDLIAMDALMTARGIPHDLRVVEGPHDYIFNRGAGGVEMLLFHDRASRGLPAE